MGSSNYTRTSYLMALFTERYTSRCEGFRAGLPDGGSVPNDGARFEGFRHCGGSG